MKNQLLVFLLLFYIFDTVSAQIIGDSITLSTETGNIHGTLLVTDSAKKTPVALIISGSGPTDRNGNNSMMTNNSLKMLAEALYKKGISSLRYDKRGIAASQSAGVDEAELRFEHYIEDAKAWLDLLKNDSRFSEIITLGHSEGSLIGMIASQDDRADKYISLSGLGSPAAEILQEQLKKQPEFVLNQSLPIIKKLEKGELVEEVPPLLNSLFRPSVQPYLISWFKYRPIEEVKKLKIPVLIVQGTADVQVAISEAEKLHEANPTSTLIDIEGMNHILKDSSKDFEANMATYTNPNLPINNQLSEFISDFVFD